MKKIVLLLLLLLLLCSACVLAQNTFNPTMSVTTQMDANSTYNLLTPISTTTTTSLSVTTFSKASATQAFNISFTVGTQVDANSTYRLSTASLNIGATTSMAVSTFLRGTAGNTFSPTMSDKAQADLNATLNLKTAINASPTIGMAVTTFLRSVQGNNFTPTIADKAQADLNASLSLKTALPASPTIGMAVTQFLAAHAVQNYNFNPAAADTIATTGGFDSSGSVPGIGFATSMSVVSFLHGVSPLLPTMSVTTAMSPVFLSQPASSAASVTTTMTAQNALTPKTPATNDPTVFTAAIGYGTSATANPTTAMLISAFIKNATGAQSLNPTLALTTGAGAAFGTVSSPQIGVTTLATAAQGPGPNSATQTAVGTAVTASFHVAASFAPSAGITTNMGIAQFSTLHTFSISPQQTTTIAAQATLNDVNAAAASMGTSMTTGFGSSMHATAAPVTAMACAFTVTRFNSSHKIMEIIS